MTIDIRIGTTADDFETFASLVSDPAEIMPFMVFMERRLDGPLPP